MGNNYPKTVDECVIPDELSSTLREWAEKIESVGKVLLGIIITVGILSVIALSKEYESSENLGAVVITSLCETAISALIEYAAYNIASIFLKAFSNIHHNIRATAKLTEYMARKQEPVEDEPTQDEIPQDEPVLDESKSTQNEHDEK